MSSDKAAIYREVHDIICAHNVMGGWPIKEIGDLIWEHRTATKRARNLENTLRLLRDSYVNGVGMSRHDEVAGTTIPSVSVLGYSNNQIITGVLDGELGVTTDMRLIRMSSTPDIEVVTKEDYQLEIGI